MATGIEVAGVVLAVLPLFISALEHYSAGMDPMRAFLEFESQLPNQIRKLRDQHINYNLTIRILLSSIAEADEVDKMISDPGGSSWRDNSMQRRLEERLDESYQAYLDTITHMEKIMKTIAKYLKIDQIDRTSRADLQLLLQATPKNRFEFGRRVKFSMKLKKLKGLLDELDSENQKLERFTNKTERLEPYRRAKKTSIFNPPLNEIRLYAKNLYEVLCIGAGCSQSRHQAKLQLEKRLYPKPTKASLKSSNDVNKNTRPCFKVSLYYSRWQDVEIQILESDFSLGRQEANRPRQNSQTPEELSKPKHETESIALSLVTGNKGLVLVEESHEHIGKLSGLHTILERSLKLSKKGSEYSKAMSHSADPIVNKCFDKVQNGTVHIKPAVTSTTKPKHVSKAVGWAISETSTMTVNELPTGNSNSLQEVVDICTAIRMNKTRKACVGLCLDHSGKLRSALLTSQPEKQSDGNPVAQTTENYEGTSLNKLLIDDPNHCGYTFSRKDRMSLALILASSFVQLEATQWIKDSWGKENIIFDQSLDTTGDGSVDISKPCILQSIDRQVAESTTEAIHRSENFSLLNLGVLLLELSTGQSFEQYQSRTKGKCVATVDPPEESVKRMMKLSEASRWLKSVQDDLSSGFHGAIQHCIRSYFDDASGKDEALYRQRLLDQVVLPLQEDLQSFLSTRAI